MIDRCESIKSDQFANYGEHGDLCAAGWREVEWYRGGFLRGGYANQGEEGTQQWRERLWLSPHCLGVRQRGLFDTAAGAR
jgi:hypothetical protein